MFHIVLVEPEIPQNTGNIARTCAVTGAHLHLVRPLGFRIDDRKLKRAGLDYWDQLPIFYHDSFDEIEQEVTTKNARMFLCSTKAAHSYAHFHFEDGDYFVFGKETAGLPAELLERYTDNAMRIPMREELRSLNLSNSVCIVLYEALRQVGFPNMT